VLRQTDVLFLNESEAMQLTRRDNAMDALKLIAGTVNCVVIKLGPKGAVAMRNNVTEFVAGFAVESIDSTGAGDSFAAGFLHGFLGGRDLDTCLRFGNACGAMSTLRAGGTTYQPSLQQLNEFLKLHK
jgi:sugar/nucleoside kinase (ribokinase family)